MMLRTAAIGDFCETGTGGTPSRAKAALYYDGGSIPWVKSGELKEKIVYRTEEHLTEYALKESSAKIVPSGSILLAMYGATVGRVGVLGVPAATNQAICHIVPNPEVAEKRFVYWALRASVPELLAQRVGGAQPNINQSIIRRLRILLPSLEGQRRIADILDRAEALRAKRKAALAQLDNLTQSTYLEMFGDPLRNISRWQQSRINEICNLVRGSSPRPKGDPRYFGGPVPRLMIADITRDGWVVTPRIDTLTDEGAKRSRPVAAETIVMAVSGNVGLAAQLAIDACIHDGFVAFTDLARGVAPVFLLATLRFSKSAHDKSKAGAIFVNITTNDIKNLQISIPPITLQQEFARRVEAIDRLKSKYRQSLAELDALFLSLQHRAFRGEL